MVTSQKLTKIRVKSKYDKQTYMQFLKRPLEAAVVTHIFTERFCS